MAKYLIGDIIRHWREQAGMTVNELAGNVVNASTVWRIEQGYTLPSKDTMEYLFQKLGIDPNDMCSTFFDSNMAEIQSITDKLDGYLTNHNSVEAGKLIAELEQSESFMTNKFRTQYILAAKASMATSMDVNPSDVLEMYEKAISVAWGNYEEDQIASYFLSRIDFNILSGIAGNLSKLGNNEKAVFISQQMLGNVKSNYLDKIEKGRRYPSIVYNLTNYLFDLERHSEVIALCDEGKRVCIETEAYRLLPAIMANKAFSLLALGEKDKFFKLIDEVHKSYLLRDKHVEIERIKDYAAKIGIVLDW